MLYQFKLKCITTTIIFMLTPNFLWAHEIRFFKKQSETKQPQELIRNTLEKSCRSVLGQPLLLTEALSRNNCEYENKWCENNGLSVLDTPDQQTIVVQYTEDWGNFKIAAILSNSDMIICEH